MNRLALVAITLAACGDNNATPDAPGTRSPTACRGRRAPAIPRAVVVAAGRLHRAGDPGVISTVDVLTLLTHQNITAGVVGDDPVLRQFGNELYVVNRSDGNNVTILDATTFAVLDQIATGAGSNPQDVAVVGDKLYIPVLGGPGVLVVTRSTNAMSMIDLSADDPGDGLPDCNSVYAVSATNAWFVTWRDIFD